MIRRLTLLLLTASGTYALLHLHGRVHEVTAERDHAQNELNTERLLTARLSRELASWLAWWEQDGPYLMALAAQKRAQGIERLLRDVRAMPPRTHTLDDLLEGN